MKISRIPLFLIMGICFIAASIGGVWASWRYVRIDVESISVDTSVSITDFGYKPEEVLPDQEYDKIKENHVYLINNILYYTSYNINTGNKKVIHDYLDEYGVIYGNQNVSGGNLKHVLAASDSVSGGIQFAMSKISDTEYHTFTFSQNDLDNAEDGIYSLTDNCIEVYKTVMIYAENDKGTMEWQAVRAYQGKAKTTWCSTDKGRVFSINISTWVEI